MMRRVYWIPIILLVVAASAYALDVNVYTYPNLQCDEYPVQDVVPVVVTFPTRHVFLFARYRELSGYRAAMCFYEVNLDDGMLSNYFVDLIGFSSDVYPNAVVMQPFPFTNAPPDTFDVCGGIVYSAHGDYPTLYLKCLNIDDLQEVYGNNIYLGDVHDLSAPQPSGINTHDFLLIATLRQGVAYVSVVPKTINSAIASTVALNDYFESCPDGSNCNVPAPPDLLYANGKYYAVVRYEVPNGFEYVAVCSLNASSSSVSVLQCKDIYATTVYYLDVTANDSYLFISGTTMDYTDTLFQVSNDSLEPVHAVDAPLGGLAASDHNIYLLHISYPGGEPHYVLNIYGLDPEHFDEPYLIEEYDIQQLGGVDTSPARHIKSDGVAVYFAGIDNDSNSVVFARFAPPSAPAGPTYPSDNCTSWTDISGMVTITTSGCYRVTADYTNISIQGGDSLVFDLNGHTQVWFNLCPSSEINIQEFEVFNGAFGTSCSSYRTHLIRTYLHDLSYTGSSEIYLQSVRDLYMKDVHGGGFTITVIGSGDPSTIEISGVRDTHLILSVDLPATVNISDSNFASLYTFFSADATLTLSDTNLTHRTGIYFGGSATVNVNLTNVLLDGRPLTYAPDITEWVEGGAYLVDVLPTTSPVHVYYVGAMRDRLYHLSSDYGYADYIAISTLYDSSGYDGSVVPWFSVVYDINNTNIDLYPRDRIVSFLGHNIIDSNVTIHYRDAPWPEYGTLYIQVNDVNLYGSTIRAPVVLFPQPPQYEANIYDGTIDPRGYGMYFAGYYGIPNTYNIHRTHIYASTGFEYFGANPLSTINFIGAKFSGPSPITIAFYGQDVNVHFKDVYFAVPTTITCYDPVTIFLEGNTNTDNVTVDQSCQLAEIPNLAVKEISYSPELAHTDSTISVYAVIENNYSSSFTTDVALYLDGNLVVSKIVSLSPGDNNVLITDTLTIPTSGTHTLTVAVDTNNTISESDEQDNTLDLNIYVYRHIVLTSCVGTISEPSVVDQQADFINAPAGCVVLDTSEVFWYAHGYSFTGTSAFRIAGSTDLNIYGDGAQELYITLDGTGTIHVYDYNVLALAGKLSSSASVHVHDVNYLSFRSSGNDSVYAPNVKLLEYYAEGCGALHLPGATILPESGLVPVETPVIARYGANPPAPEPDKFYILRCVGPPDVVDNIFNNNENMGFYLTTSIPGELHNISNYTAHGAIVFLARDYSYPADISLHTVTAPALEASAISQFRMTGSVIGKDALAQGYPEMQTRLILEMTTYDISDTNIDVDYMVIAMSHGDISKVRLHTSQLKAIGSQLQIQLTDGPSTIVVDQLVLSDLQVSCTGSNYLYTNDVFYSMLPASCPAMDINGNIYVSDLNIPNEVSTGEPLPISFTISSTHAFAPDFNVAYSIYVDGTEVYSGTVTLSAGSTAPVEVNITAPATTDTYTLEVIVSPAEGVTDTNGADNSVSASFAVVQNVPQESPPSSVGAGASEVVAAPHTVYVTGKVGQQKVVEVPIFWTLPFKAIAKVHYEGAVTGPEKIELNPGKNVLKVTVTVSGPGEVGRITIQAGSYKTTAYVYSQLLAQSPLAGINIHTGALVLVAVALLALYLFGRR